MSYLEVELAALIGVVSETFLFHSGHRYPNHRDYDTLPDDLLQSYVKDQSSHKYNIVDIKIGIREFYEFTLTFRLISGCF